MRKKKNNISFLPCYEVDLCGSKLIQNLHHFAAASGDHVALMHVHQLMADGAIDVAFFFCPNHAVQAEFQFVFHKSSLSLGVTAGSVCIAVPL